MLATAILKRRIKKYIKRWEREGYASGIPDEADPVLESFNLVPSYRLICMAIMKNDVNLISLGFNKPRCNLYHVIKKAELISRGVIKPDTQGKFNL